MELHIGERYAVKVIKLEKFGAIVEMSDDTTNLIHISNIANCYVRAVEDFVSVGNIYLAEAVEGKSRPVELSLKHLNLTPATYPPALENCADRPKTTYRPSSNSIHTGSASKHKLAGKSKQYDGSIDSMIEEADKALKDKMSRYASNSNQRRNTRQSRRRD